MIQELEDTRTLVSSGGFTRDVDFQEHVQRIFQKTIDAHTRYNKPACYNTIFVAPFAFDMKVPVNESKKSEDTEPKVLLINNLYTPFYHATFPSIPLTFLTKQVVLLNGIEVTTAIAAWGDGHETRSNNPSARFNAALRSFLYRSAISLNVLPLEDLTITLIDGTNYTLPWLATYTTGFGEDSFCAAQPLGNVSTFNKEALSSISPTPGRDILLEPPQLLDPTILGDPSKPDRRVIIPSNSTSHLSCFIQVVQPSQPSIIANIQNVLVMKVASFSPSGGDSYLDDWSLFLNDAKTCLSQHYQMIVVDVMQNGGGYVCLGLRLIELLVKEYEEDHTLVQMKYDLPHSSLMDLYIEKVNDPNPYPDPAAVEPILNPSTQEPYTDGKAYYYPGNKLTQGGVVSWRTNFFTLDCQEAEAMPVNWKPTNFMPPDRLIILTDGTCGSTCASFVKIPQEAGKATFLGVGGLWGQSMDVCSFAGGFVCKPEYLQYIAEMSGTTFPSFLTNQKWQFAWATWYSARFPSRQTQFTTQDPNYRLPFWGFPHPSISSTVTTTMVSVLYDTVITQMVARSAALAAATYVPAAEYVDECELSDLSSTGWMLWVVTSVGFGLFMGAIFLTFYFMRNKIDPSLRESLIDR